jgi:hypothetical protein
MPNQPPNLLSRVSMWRREIADSLVLYSISILACAATFYSKLFENYVNFSRAQDGLGAEKSRLSRCFWASHRRRSGRGGLPISAMSEFVGWRLSSRQLHCRFAIR